MTATDGVHLVILFGSGGLSDVGRHALQAALERPLGEIASCTVLTQHPAMLDESDWKCGCPEPHSFSDEERSRFELICVQSWQDDDLSPHFVSKKDPTRKTVVVSCLGNRQPFIGDWVATEGNAAVLGAIKSIKNKNGVQKQQQQHRVVVMSSMGIEEDWPPMEYFWAGKILACIFLSCGRRAFRDLTDMERLYRRAGIQDDVDYLLIRPAGLGEDVLPQNEWFLQKEKYKDELGVNIAKLDVARYMIEEAINPRRHKAAVCIGPKPPTKPTALSDKDKKVS